MSQSRPLNQIEHFYPSQVHILNNPYLSYLAARLSQPESRQPWFNQAMRDLYVHFFVEVLNHCWPLETQVCETRMTALHPEQRLEHPSLSAHVQAICVDMARAGMIPSQVIYDQLNQLLPPERVRQDHIFASRIANNAKQVTHTELSSSKIGGPIDQAFVLIPDPMGATGHSLCEVVDYYKRQVPGDATRFVSLHMVITPEFIRKVTQEHPDLHIYAVRLDRGFSSPKALSSSPGRYWDEEKGLNDSQYIVPGAGGVGELMNNSFV